MKGRPFGTLTRHGPESPFLSPGHSEILLFYGSSSSITCKNINTMARGVIALQVYSMEPALNLPRKRPDSDPKLVRTGALAKSCAASSMPETKPVEGRKGREAWGNSTGTCITRAQPCGCNHRQPTWQNTAKNPHKPSYSRDGPTRSRPMAKTCGRVATAKTNTGVIIKTWVSKLSSQHHVKNEQSGCTYG